MTLDGGTLESYWSTAATRPVVSKFRTVDVGVHTTQGPVLAAVQDDGRRHLLVPIDPKHTLKQELDGQAVTLSRRVLEDSSSYRAYAALALVDDALGDLFTALCVEVVERIAESPTKAVAALKKALADWRALLAGARRILTPFALAGLFGELHLLRSMTAVDPGAVAFWTGPSGTAQDFYKMPDALEVKTTTSPEGRTIRVHGIDQLDVAPPGRLLLIWMRVRTDRGLSVPDLVDEILDVTDDSKAFLDTLRLVGYHQSDREIYARRPFEVVERRTYRVGPGFPRITAACLHGDAALGGLDSVHYDLDLGTAAADGARVDIDPALVLLGQA